MGFRSGISEVGTGILHSSSVGVTFLRCHHIIAKQLFGFQAVRSENLLDFDFSMCFRYDNF